MTKSLLAGLGLLLAASTAHAAEPIFSADFTADGNFTEQDFAKWKVIDANTDQKTWQFSASGSPSKVYYSYHSSNNGDDWLISPSFTVPSAGTYLVRFVACGSSYGEAYEVWYGNDTTVSAMTTKGAENLELKGSATAGYFIATFSAGQKVHLGFHAVSPADRFRLYINSVTVAPISNPMDIGVSEIISPVTGENLGQETLTVKVQNFLSSPVTGFDINYTVNGGSPVTEHVTATIPGNGTIEYSFTAKVDCSVPRSATVIKVYTSAEGDVNPDNDAATTTVRHIAPAGIPYANGFEPEDDCSNFTYLNLNNDDGDWSVGTNSFFSQFSRTGEGYLAYNYNKNNNADDWVFIDPLQMDAGDYMIRFWYSATENHKEKMKVCWGTAPTPEAMTNVIVDLDSITNDSYLESISIFKIPASQKVFIGFYAYSDKDENWLIIDDLLIEKVDPTKFDLIVHPLTEPYTYLRTRNRRDVVASIQNVGVRDANITVNVYVDENLKKSQQDVIGFMATKDYKFENILTDLSEGKHSVKVEVVGPNDPNTDNNVQQRDIYILEQQPVLLYDFEDEAFPDSLTYRIEDSATLNSSATGMFGPKGLAILGVENHYLYQYNALAICTWFEDPTSTADRWLVLPKLHINDANCHLVWDASSFSTTALEKYDVCVSTTQDKWYEYSTLLSVADEDQWSKTRGVSLADYNGKDVYLAFHLKTTGGNALILDNIGVHGNITYNSVAGIADEELSIIADGNLLLCNMEASINVMNLSGMTVASAQGMSLDISQLPAGVYLAKAISGRNIRTVKFVKK